MVTIRKMAPWTDFKGNLIFEGSIIKHPVSGQTGTVIYRKDGESLHDKWLVGYGNGVEARLSLQIGDKGQAEVIYKSTF